MSGDSPRSLSDGDNGATVEVRRGESIQIDLRENATTGYRWELGAALPPFLKMSAETHAPPGGGSGIGSGGVAQFEFVASEGGSGEVVLVNKRGWEAQPAQTYRVRVSSA